MQSRAGISYRDGTVEAGGDHPPHSASVPDQQEANGESNLQRDKMGYRSMSMNAIETTLVCCKLNIPVEL